MKASSPAKIVSIGGILTALAVLFQSSPVFLPGIGLFLSPLATLPIAIAALTSTSSGIIALFSSAFILLLISPQESVIFLFTTGALGLALGASYNKSYAASAAIAGGTLFIGINILTYAVGISVFGDLTPDSSLIAITLIFVIFSLCYSAIWALVLKLLIKIFKRAASVSRP